MNNRNLIIAGAVAVVLAVVVFLVLGGGDRRSEGPGGDADGGEYVSGGDLDARDVNERLEYRFKPGKVYRYDFSRNIKIEGQGEQLVDQEHGGPFALHAVGAESQFLDLILELDPSGELEANLSPGAKTILVRIRIDRRGRVAGLKWRKETGKDLKNPLRDIILSFFKTLPAPGSKPEGVDGGIFDSIFGGGASLLSYVVPGQDTFGAFLDALEVRAGDQSLKLRGRKQEYTRAPVPVVIEESRFEVEWDVAGGYFKNSRGDEKLRLSAQGLELTASGKYNFDFQGVEDSTFTDSDLARFTISGSAFDFEAGADTGLAFDESAIRPWGDLQNMLTSLTAGVSAEEKQALFHSLSESMKRDPGIADQALRVAADYTPDDDQFQMVMGSVAYSGAPIAQDLLVNFYNEQQLDENGQLSVINAMTMMSQPLTGDALELVSGEFQNGKTTEVRDAAGLALGAALRNNPESRDLYQTILDEWNRAKGTGREAAVIEMIGNSGDPRYFPILKEALVTENDNFRLQVIAAMRHMYDKEVQALLLNEMQTHASATMRAAAMEALGSHPWQSAFLDPMKDCVRTQPNDRVRILCSEFALGERLAAPEMLDVLRNLNTGGLSEDFKTYVTQQLSEN